MSKDRGTLSKGELLRMWLLLLLPVCGCPCHFKWWHSAVTASIVPPIKARKIVEEELLRNSLRKQGRHGAGWV